MRRPVPGRTGRRVPIVGAVAVALLGLVIGPTVLTSTRAAAAGTTPVPCEVAMTAGCGTPDRANDQQGDQPSDQEPTGSPSDDPANATASLDNPTDDPVSASSSAGSAPATPVVTPDTFAEPSGVDPWERGGLKANFGTGSIPLSHYQIGADTTGLLGVPDPLSSFLTAQTNWAFTTASFLVLLATNALDWAFEFPLATELVGQAGLLAQSYNLDLFGFGLNTSVYGLALGLTMIVAGFRAVNRGVIAAGGEVLPAVAAYVVLTVLTLTSSFGAVGLDVARVSSELSGSIAGFAAGQERQEECAAALVVAEGGSRLAGASTATEGVPGVEPTFGPAVSDSSGSVACSFGHSLQRSLVELPYQNIQWGQVLDGAEGKEACARINRELLVDGPWGNSDVPRDRMGAEAACAENARFNGQASYIRLGVAAANTVAVALVTVLILMVAAMLVWQQLKLLFLTAVLPHALVFAILPGQWRSLAWRWLEAMIGVVIRTVILALGLVVWLSLFSLVVYEQLTFRGLFLSLFASTALAVAGFYGLYQMSGVGRGLSRLPARRSGGGGDGPDPDQGSTGPAPAGSGDRPRAGAAAASRVAVSSARTVRQRTTNRSESVLAFDPGSRSAR